MLYLTIFIALLSAVSANVQPDDVKYYLTNERVSLIEIKTGDYGLTEIDAAKDVKIICHGWVDNVDSSWYGPTKSEYVKKSGANVIGLDWGVYASGSYSSAVASVNGVGYQLALFILDLSATYNIPLSRVHLIGHSLGAHVSGYAGKHITALSGQKVGRITGLDPAGPSFAGVAESQRLCSNDATFVDIMHTDTTLLGLKDSIGHVDFFPNGGSSQNGCGILAIGCSHNRAPLYFFESINSYGFAAVACSSASDFNNGRCAANQKTVMGENVDQTARGTFFLRTASASPFGLGTV